MSDYLRPPEHPNEHAKFLQELCRVVNDTTPVKFVNIKKFGAVGNGVRDDTAAFEDCLNYLKDVGGTKLIYLPSGTYKVGHILVEDLTNISIRGDSRRSSIIEADVDSGAFLEFSAFETAPASAWGGSCQGVHFKDLSILRTADLNIANTGSRGVIGVQDNGNGNFFFHDVRIAGFQYGVASPYGGDFNSYRNLQVSHCDVGVYLGPRSQQYSFTECEIFLCGEGLVFENAKQGRVLSCYLQECKDWEIAIESNDTTRFAISPLWGHVEKELSVSIRDSWFETGAGWETGWDHQAHIITRTDNVAEQHRVRHIKVDNCLVIPGTTGMGTKDPAKVYSFWKHDGGRFCRLTNTVIDGDRLDAIVDNDSYTGGVFQQENSKTVDGWTTVPFYSTAASGYTHFDVFNNTMPQMYRAWAAPVSGTYKVGDIVWDYVPVGGGTMGWVCVTAGTPGTWKAFGDIAA